jgi:outer membrane protein assembly factor BamB
MGPNSNSHFYAVTKDGHKKWSIKLPFMYASPTVASDGTIYIGSLQGAFSALNPDKDNVKPEKRIKWQIQLDSNDIFATASLGSDGTIYVGSRSGIFFAIDPHDGAIRWSLVLDDSAFLGYGISGAAAIGLDGIIYVVSGDGRLNAINPDGTMKWRKKLYESYTYHWDEYFASPSIATDGTIYLAGFDGKFYVQFFLN